jgi:hypothetical protein
VSSELPVFLRRETVGCYRKETWIERPEFSSAITPNLTHYECKKTLKKDKHS